MTDTNNKSPVTHLRVADIRGFTQLTVQAVAGVIRVVEGVHQSVLQTVGVSSRKASGDSNGLTDGLTNGSTGGLTGLVYRTIYATTRLTGKALDKGLEKLLPKSDSTAQHSTGDGLVPIGSALGVDQLPDRSLVFQADNQWVAYETNHMALLSSNKVIISYSTG